MAKKQTLSASAEHLIKERQKTHVAVIWGGGEGYIPRIDLKEKTRWEAFVDRILCKR